MIGLKGKRVLITGGASGIGAEAARRFLREGAQVAVLDRDRVRCERIRAELPALSGVLRADVCDPAAVGSAFVQLDGLFGGIDVLINNAGISKRHAFVDITLEEWDEVLRVNLTGAFNVAQSAARRMLAAGGGVIINMASTNGMRGYPMYAAYNASKAGVIALTQTMALELAPHIRVIAVCPGYVITPMQRAEYSASMLAEVNEKIPMRRHAEPWEVAALFAFLASEEAAFISGHPVIIDGGEISGGLASR
jgi:meso-butanediol dehydrogenase/(S,S)-butanediol dehydrogenase/diacetyl reductase